MFSWTSRWAAFLYRFSYKMRLDFVVWDDRENLAEGGFKNSAELRPYQLSAAAVLLFDHRASHRQYLSYKTLSPLLKQQGTGSVCLHTVSLCAVL